MSPVFKRWLVGLLNAGLSGAAAAFVSAGVGVNLKQCLLITGGSVAMSLAKWIPQHPLPGAEETVKQVQSVATDLGDGQVAVSTVEKTTTTPVAKP